MSKEVIALMGSLWLIVSMVSCNSTNERDICHAGCLCSTTPQECPSSCYPTYRQTDAGTVFFCDNFPPPDGGPVRIPLNHRATGSICPQDRGAGVADVSSFCSQGGGPVVPRCTGDSDCTSGVNGRCLASGGPACNYYCSYDDCTSDSDCAGNAPCACRSSSGDPGPNSCATASNCRVDADCGPGGFCSPSLVNKACQCQSASFCGAPTAPGTSCNGNCGHGYFCHTPNDRCIDDSDCGGGLCTFDLTGQTWVCVSLCIGPL